MPGLLGQGHMITRLTAWLMAGFGIGLLLEERSQPAGSEKPGRFVPNVVNMLEGFGSPEVGREVDFEAWRPQGATMGLSGSSEPI